jgi:hypothetical protein
MRVCSASTSFAAAAVMIRAWSSVSIGAADDARLSDHA